MTTRRELLKLGGAAAAVAAVGGCVPKVVEPTRYAELLRYDTWRRTTFKDLRQGDVFRLREPNGDAVDDGEICTAFGDARIVDWAEHGKQWTVTCDEWGVALRRMFVDTTVPGAIRVYTSDDGKFIVEVDAAHEQLLSHDVMHGHVKIRDRLQRGVLMRTNEHGSYAPTNHVVVRA